MWAEGLRNSVDFLFTPDGQLWADHNGSDGLGDDMPPEEIVIAVQKGAQLRLALLLHAGAGRERAA